MTHFPSSSFGSEGHASKSHVPNGKDLKKPEYFFTAECEMAPEILEKIRTSVTVSYAESGLRGIRVSHGTDTGSIDLVKSGPEDMGSGFGGKGLYLAKEGERALAEEYAGIKCQFRGTPIVLDGRLNPDKEYQVARIQLVRRGQTPNLEQGIFPADWAKNSSLQKFMLAHFDVIEVCGARTGGYAIDSDSYLVVHKRAGADAIIWDVPPRMSASSTPHSTGSPLRPPRITDQSPRPPRITDQSQRPLRITDQSQRPPRITYGASGLRGRTIVYLTGGARRAAPGMGGHSIRIHGFPTHPNPSSLRGRVTVASPARPPTSPQPQLHMFRAGQAGASSKFVGTLNKIGKGLKAALPPAMWSMDVYCCYDKSQQDAFAKALVDGTSVFAIGMGQKAVLGAATGGALTPVLVLMMVGGHAASQTPLLDTPEGQERLKRQTEDLRETMAKPASLRSMMEMRAELDMLEATRKMDQSIRVFRWLSPMYVYKASGLSETAFTKQLTAIVAKTGEILRPGLQMMGDSMMDEPLFPPILAPFAAPPPPPTMTRDEFDRMYEQSQRDRQTLLDGPGFYADGMHWTFGEGADGGLVVQTRLNIPLPAAAGSTGTLAPAGAGSVDTVPHIPDGVPTYTRDPSGLPSAFFASTDGALTHRTATVPRVSFKDQMRITDVRFAAGTAGVVFILASGAELCFAASGGGGFLFSLGVPLSKEMGAALLTGALYAVPIAAVLITAQILYKRHLEKIESHLKQDLEDSKDSAQNVEKMLRDFNASLSAFQSGALSLDELARAANQGIASLRQAQQDERSRGDYAHHHKNFAAYLYHLQNSEQFKRLQETLKDILAQEREVKKGQADAKALEGASAGAAMGKLSSLSGKRTLTPAQLAEMDTLRMQQLARVRASGAPDDLAALEDLTMGAAKPTLDHEPQPANPEAKFYEKHSRKTRRGKKETLTKTESKNASTDLLTELWAAEERYRSVLQKDNPTREECEQAKREFDAERSRVSSQLSLYKLKDGLKDEDGRKIKNLRDFHRKALQRIDARVSAAHTQMMAAHATAAKPLCSTSDLNWVACGVLNDFCDDFNAMQGTFATDAERDAAFAKSHASAQRALVWLASEGHFEDQTPEAIAQRNEFKSQAEMRVAQFEALGGSGTRYDQMHQLSVLLRSSQGHHVTFSAAAPQPPSADEAFQQARAEAPRLLELLEDPVLFRTLLGPQSKKPEDGGQEDAPADADAPAGGDATVPTQDPVETQRLSLVAHTTYFIRTSGAFAGSLTDYQAFQTLMGAMQDARDKERAPTSAEATCASGLHGKCSEAQTQGVLRSVVQAHYREVEDIAVRPGLDLTFSMGVDYARRWGTEGGLQLMQGVSTLHALQPHVLQGVVSLPIAWLRGHMTSGWWSDIWGRTTLHPFKEGFLSPAAVKTWFGNAVYGKVTNPFKAGVGSVANAQLALQVFAGPIIRRMPKSYHATAQRGVATLSDGLSLLTHARTARGLMVAGTTAKAAMRGLPALATTAASLPLAAWDRWDTPLPRDRSEYGPLDRLRSWATTRWGFAAPRDVLPRRMESASYITARDTLPTVAAVGVLVTVLGAGTPVLCASAYSVGWCAWGWLSGWNDEQATQNALFNASVYLSKGDFAAAEISVGNFKLGSEPEKYVTGWFGDSHVRCSAKIFVLQFGWMKKLNEIERLQTQLLELESDLKKTVDEKEALRTAHFTEIERLVEDLMRATTIVHRDGVAVLAESGFPLDKIPSLFTLRLNVLGKWVMGRKAPFAKNSSVTYQHITRLFDVYIQTSQAHPDLFDAKAKRQAIKGFQELAKYTRNAHALFVVNHLDDGASETKGYLDDFHAHKLDGKLQAPDGFSEPINTSDAAIMGHDFISSIALIHMRTYEFEKFQTWFDMIPPASRSATHWFEIGVSLARMQQNGMRIQSGFAIEMMLLHCAIAIQAIEAKKQRDTLTPQQLHQFTTAKRIIAGYEELKEWPTFPSLAYDAGNWVYHLNRWIKGITPAIEAPSTATTSAAAVVQPRVSVRYRNWYTLETPARGFSCGIYAMDLTQTHTDVEQKRRRLHAELLSAPIGSFTREEIDAMRDNIGIDGIEHASADQVRAARCAQIRSGDFLDPFALQRIAHHEGKHLIFIHHRDVRAQEKTLAQIYEDSFTDPSQARPAFADVVFIYHEEGHFEAVRSH